jgi:IPT/TIG domain
MANAPVSRLAHSDLPYVCSSGEGKRCHCRRRWGLLAAAVFLASLVFAQGAPRVTGVEPLSGKVNDNVTVRGENLGKDAVSAVFLSDEKDDYKATVVEQAAGRIIVKVPQVKPGDYNISIQVGDKIFIEPVRFKVQPSNPAPGK